MSRILPFLFSLTVSTSCGNLMKDGHVYFTIANDSETQMFFDWCADYPDPDTAIIREITPDIIKANHGRTLNDLNRLNWVLHYPPTPDMQDVHMYPPYGKIIENYNRMMKQEE